MYHSLNLHSNELYGNNVLYIFISALIVELILSLQLLEMKYDSAVKEQEEIRLKAEQEAEDKERRENAAIRVQRYWRVYRKRKIEAKQAQKGKKKGKGGKGKGKKKT